MNLRNTFYALLILLLLSGCGTDAAETPVPTLGAPTATPFVPNAPPPATPVVFSDFPGIFILSLNEGRHTHLYAYSPIDQPFTRLTYGEWDDITPALSPDGKQIAFASNRSGYWDLYLLDVESGETTRLTETKAYDGAPTWSPDGAWLAYETYLNDNLEVVVKSISDSSQDIVRLTDNPAADHSPVWEPGGRRIAFVSTRGGDSEIYLANLDNAESERYLNISNTPHAIESHPLWSVDGSKLLWTSNAYDNRPSGIYVWNAQNPNLPPAWVGEGDWGTWNQRANSILTMLEGESAQYLTAYSLEGELLLQPWRLPGTLQGLLWLPEPLPKSLPQNYQKAAEVTPAPLWEASAATPSLRENLVKLDVEAPYPQLHDTVDEAFSALREATIQKTGWDALTNLDNAFIPITTAADPNLREDWLYTGRAFSLNPLISNAGWMCITRHDINQQSFWSIYLRAQVQDGSMGIPLHDPVWDLNTRYSLDPANYEAGGSFMPVPAGYWVNFTDLAQNYGWQRLPALPNWRTYYKATRFTQFVKKDNLSWHEAMLKIYPPEILLTPTPVYPPTITPSPTPRPSSTPYPTWTPRTPTLTPTPISIFDINTSTPQP